MGGANQARAEQCAAATEPFCTGTKMGRPDLSCMSRQTEGEAEKRSSCTQGRDSKGSQPMTGVTTRRCSKGVFGFKFHWSCRIKVRIHSPQPGQLDTFYFCRPITPICRRQTARLSSSSPNGEQPMFAKGHPFQARRGSPLGCWRRGVLSGPGTRHELGGAREHAGAKAMPAGAPEGAAGPAPMAPRYPRIACAPTAPSPERPPQPTA